MYMKLNLVNMQVIIYSRHYNAVTNASWLFWLGSVFACEL